jgi:outer membrane protein OmpA-like peptidoglycan-associated protein
MNNKLIRLFSLSLALWCLTAAGSMAQTSSKSKSKDRLREKDDHYFPINVKNATTLNSKGSDIAPAYFKDGVMIVSARAKNGPRDQNDDPFFEFFYAPFDPNGDPTTPTKYDFDATKKSPLHEGPICFTRDFKTAFFTRTNNKDGVQKAGKSGKSKLKIYEVHYGRPDWSEPVELPFNSDDYNCVHPSLSADGTKLFFASDMPGGFGGYDLYVVDRDSTQWGKPVNLGSLINTEKREAYPFISLSGTLFFASDGRAVTKGGMDIYFVNNPLNNPTEVVNMNEPFNSEGDDKGLIIDPDGKKGFFTSDRKGGYGKEDIYKFEAPHGLEGITKPETSIARFTVTDRKTGDPIQGANIRIFKPTEDGFIGGSNNDFYSVELLPVQDKKNALTLQITLKGADDLGKPDLLSNVAGEARTDIERYRTYMIFVSVDGYRPMQRILQVESGKDLDLRFAMADAPLCLRAGGLVSGSEMGTRLPYAIITFQHKQTGQKEIVHTNLNGEFDACLPLDGDYLATVSLDGFKSENYPMTTTRGKKQFKEIRLKPLVEGVSAEVSAPLANTLQEGSIIILDKIFYEYRKSTLNQGAIRYLEALLDFFKRYPEMEIDLISHTDTRGDAKLNQQLTDERAQTAKIYLTSKGVNPEHIVAYGKGESEPRNRCVEGVECSDEEHMQNNRLEIRIRKLGKPARP